MTMNAMRPISAALLLFALAHSAGAIAQTPPAQIPPADREAIVVEAPRPVPVPAESERSPYTGAAVAITTVRMPVLYENLDLAAPEGADRLQYRLNRVAEDACRQLDRLVPFTSDPQCAGKAVTAAAPAAKAAIEAAQRNR